MSWRPRFPAPSLSHARGTSCQSRNLYATTKHSQDQPPTTTSKPLNEKEKSALDEIFDGPDAFTRQENADTSRIKRIGSNPSASVPRTVLGTDLSDEISLQLNQEWNGGSKAIRQDRQTSSYGSVPSGRGLFVKSRSNKWDGNMTPNENKIFSEIFRNFFSEDSSKEGKSITDDGGLGGTLNSSMHERLSDFRAKTIQRNRLDLKRKAARKRYLSSVLSERISGHKLSEEEIEEKIDQAREEIVACATVSELWQWAAKNVWGSQQEELIRKAEMREEERDKFLLEARKKEGADDIVEANSSIAREHETVEEHGNAIEEKNERKLVEEKGTEEIRFGMATPYYSPVLLLLLINLRERFRSPQSALAVLRVARNLGPDSFVLGCSPQLYAEALRTKYVVLKDLQGARDILREAKDTGILGRDSISYPTSLISDKDQKPEHEGVMLRDIVTKQIVTAVHQHIREGTKRLSKGQTPLVYERQMELIAEMDDIIGTYKKPSPGPFNRNRPARPHDLQRRPPRLQNV